MFLLVQILINKSHHSTNINTFIIASRLFFLTVIDNTVSNCERYCVWSHLIVSVLYVDYGFLGFDPRRQVHVQRPSQRPVFVDVQLKFHYFHQRPAVLLRGPLGNLFLNLLLDFLEDFNKVRLSVMM